MKRKLMSGILAIIIAFSAMLVPLSVFAAEDKDTTPPRVDVESLALSHNYLIPGDLLNISIGIRKEQETAAFCVTREILHRESQSFLFQVLRLDEVRRFCDELKTSRRFHAFLNPLILHSD